jgi:xanthine dehydrogenase accessory factor
MMEREVVVVKGGGDLASGVIARLVRIGRPVIVTELPQPTFVRRTVSFGAAIYEGEIIIEELAARRVSSPDEALATLAAGAIPVLADPDGAVIRRLHPGAVVDAIMAKYSTGTTLEDAPQVIALGPGFTAGVDCHAVVETNRGHNLGRVLWQGGAEPNTGVPGEIGGKSRERVLRAPAAGHLMPQVEIGATVTAGTVIATVAGKAVTAPFSGVLRGLLHPAVAVTAGMKIGDLDPRAAPIHCFTISDKALAIGGGVVEALLTAHRRETSTPHPLQHR